MITTKRLALALAALTALAVGVAGVPVADLADAAPAAPASRVPCPGGTNPGVDPTTGNQCHGGGGGIDGGSDGADGDGGDGGGGSDDGGGGDGGDGGSAPRPPTRDEIETAVQWRVLLKATTYLLQPRVSFDAGERPRAETGPGGSADADVDAHVGLATFIEVTNWQGPQYDPYSEVDPFGQTWYLNITATPRLSFDPGEPEAPLIRCEDGGTRYDPAGPSIEEQASRPGACAYEYTMRTGVDGRPDAWPARVIVDWTITWETNLEIPVNLPQSAQLVASVPREVGEVSTVVADD